jgi:hypothetical protein
VFSLNEPSTQGLVINRYIHLNPVGLTRLGGHEERSGETANRLTGELAKAETTGEADLGRQSGLKSIFAALIQF